MDLALGRTRSGKEKICKLGRSPISNYHPEVAYMLMRMLSRNSGLSYEDKLWREIALQPCIFQSHIWEKPDYHKKSNISFCNLLKTMWLSWLSFKVETESFVPLCPLSSINPIHYSLNQDIRRFQHRPETHWQYIWLVKHIGMKCFEIKNQNLKLESQVFLFRSNPRPCWLRTSVSNIQREKR